MKSETDLIRDIDFEISSICNAGCSVCMRRRHGHYTEFTSTYWSIEEVQRVLDEGIIKNLLGFNICGNFGDAMGNPDVVKIIEWIRSINPKCSINIRTNGGIGDAEQYRKLAELKVIISFGIDGIGEANELYRVNVKWDKLNENVVEFSKYAEPWQKELQFLLWNETIDQIIPILDYVEKNDFGRLYLRKPYTMGKYTEVFDMKSRSTHFLTEITDPQLSFISETHWNKGSYMGLKEKISKLDLKINPIKLSDLEIKPRIYNEPREYTKQEVTFEQNELDSIKNKNVQTCFSKNRGDNYNLKESLYNVYITHDKLLMPCCMIPPYISNSITHCSGHEKGHSVEVLNKIADIGVENFSLKNKTMREVMDSGVLNKFVYDDLQNNTPFLLCKQHCGRCIV
jgi:sulfatase maturation enzyme AslB (radical SAM superfamily)